MQRVLVFFPGVVCCFFFFKSRRDSPIPLLSTLNWLPVDKIIISYKLATMYQKSIYGKVPYYLSNIFQLYTPSRHLRSSSGSKLFVTPRLRLKMFGERFFSICDPKLGNSLPKDFIETASLDTFKLRLKTLLSKS